MGNLSDTALIVVDVQKGFDEVEFWGARNNSSCESNIAFLIAKWREWQYPVVFVRHDSKIPGSPLFPNSLGNSFKDVIDGTPNVLISKSVNSAFLGTPNLHEWLQEHKISSVAICGITTNHCCETTARFAGNLGYETYFVIDATYTFDRRALDGTIITADELSKVTAANLQDEFAKVVTVSEMIKAVSH